MQQQEAQQSQDWTQHPNLGSIDAAKLQMLQSFVSQGQGKSQSDMLPFLMMAMQSSQNSGMSFNTDEISQIIEVLKIGKSEKEVSKMEQMLDIVRSMRR
jgi:hypothetical protein